MGEAIGIAGELEIFKCSKNLGAEVSMELVNSVLYNFYIDFGIPIMVVEELTDSELRSLALQSGTYEFWDAPEEDVYSFEDGRPV